MTQVPWKPWGNVSKDCEYGRFFGIKAWEDPPKSSRLEISNRNDSCPKQFVLTFLCSRKKSCHKWGQKCQCFYPIGPTDLHCASTTGSSRQPVGGSWRSLEIQARMRWWKFCRSRMIDVEPGSNKNLSKSHDPTSVQQNCFNLYGDSCYKPMLHEDFLFRQDSLE